MAQSKATSDLKRRMEEQTAGARKSAPSMVPDYDRKQHRHYAPPKEEEVLPELQELVTDARDLDVLQGAINLHAAYNSEKHKLEKAMAPLADTIKSLLDDYQVSKAQCGDCRVSYYRVHRSAIKADLLLAHGVSPATIEASTVVSESATLKITKAEE